MTTRATSATWLTGTVVAIGLASLLSDACYELIIPLLPGFIASLGGGAAALGLIEGVADGLAAAFKLWAGNIADYTSRRRALTASGYVGVGIFMPAIAFATSILAVLALRSAAWICRGFRAPIRDTLLVDGTDPKYVNRAFGFQRSLDTVGAVIGPAAAIALIALHVPVRDAILFGFIPGLLAGVMYFWVRERPRSVPPRERLQLAVAELPGEFKRFVLGAGIFGVGNFSATLLVLVAIRAFGQVASPQTSIGFATALYLVHNVISASLSYPASLWSERLGSGRLLVLSYGMFVTSYALLAFGSLSPVVVIICVALAATSIGILEPMEGTFATALLPARRRGTGFGVLAAVNGIGDFISSAGVGILWQTLGPSPAFIAAAAVCALGIAVVAPVALKNR